MGIILIEEEELKGKLLLGDNTSVLVSTVDTKDLCHVFEHMEEKKELAQKLRKAYKNNQSICNDDIKIILDGLKKNCSTEDEVLGAIGSGMGGLHIKMNWSIINEQRQNIFGTRRQFAIIADPVRMMKVIYKMETRDGSTNGNLGKTLEMEDCTEQKLNSFLSGISETDNNEINTLYLNPDAILGILFMIPKSTIRQALQDPEEYVTEFGGACETILQNLRRGLPVYVREGDRNFKYCKTIAAV